MASAWAPRVLTEHDPLSLPGCFDAAMARLGPFEPRPRLAVAVSGGADSMALALLAQYWAEQRGGAILALTVDHGLRAQSASEAQLTLRRLTDCGIAGRTLTIAGLVRGAALAARARDARYSVLTDACVAEGIPHLLLGHHRADQVETVMMRALSGSAARGLAGMPALIETRYIRLLRPLLGFPADRARRYLEARDVAWVEDPSNRDRSALRVRLRVAIGDPAGTGEASQAVAEAAHRAGVHRAERDRAVAQILAERAAIRPEGFAVLTPGAIDPEALAALLRTIAGAEHTPPISSVAALARALRPAVLGLVRIAPAGRFGPGWLICRERRGIERPVPARLNTVWDRRFRLVEMPPDNAVATIGALGFDAARFRNRDGLPTLLLHGLPALRLDAAVVAVPHIGVGDPRWRLIFDPRNSAASAPFLA